MYVLLSGPFTIATSLPRLSSTPRTESSLTAIADALSIFTPVRDCVAGPSSVRNGSRRPPGSYAYESDGVPSDFGGSGVAGATFLTSLRAAGGATGAGGGAVIGEAGGDAFVCCALSSAVAHAVRATRLIGRRTRMVMSPSSPAVSRRAHSLRRLYRPLSGRAERTSSRHSSR